ncbi:hypothetical protein CER19_25275 [Pseudomonas sp. GL93]|nr:hypothetical protein CER19_25275 [Pseudomonas sp. GL93]
MPVVGASLLAKNLQAPRSFRKHALSLTFFASKLAPTFGPERIPINHADHPLTRQAWRVCLMIRVRTSATPRHLALTRSLVP